MPKIKLQDAYKQSTDDLDKALPPGETLRRFKDKLKQLDLDILEDVTRIDNGRLNIPVYISYYGKDARRFAPTHKQMGKGATPQQAEASAVMELVERFSFFYFHHSAPMITDTFKNLGEKAIPFDLIAQSVNDDTEDLDQARKIFENLPLRWAEGCNLTRRQDVLIPYDWFFAINEFNGACAGNCVEEALCQGICEVVERHVSAVVSRTRKSPALIRPESAADPVVLEMMEKYRQAGIQLWLSDFTLDTGIPTVAALAYDPTTFPEKSEIVWTAGTTSSPQKSLSRALSETAQLGGDFNTGANYVASGLPKFMNIQEADFITRSSRTVDISDLPDLSNSNIRIEIENILGALSSRGMETLAVSTAHPQLDIPAFYTMIPGAHFRERAVNSSVGLFCAKLISEQNPAPLAVIELLEMDKTLPGKYYVHFYLGSAYLSLGEYEKSLAHLNRALELEPSEQDAPSIYSYMAVCLKDMERYEEALAVINKGIALDSERTDLYNLKGFCHFKRKEHPEAVQAFKSVIRLNPGSAIDYANIASNYRDMGDKENAIVYYQMALSIDSSIDFARENLEKLAAE